MLTALTIKEEKATKWYKKIINKIKGNTVEMTLKSARGVSLRHITYTNRTGKLDWGRLNMVIGNHRNHLLCSKNIILPSEIGFRRFDNVEFKNRIATNMGIYILSQLDMKDTKVGFYDPKGENTDALPHLIKYTGDLIVVTDDMTAFDYEVRNVYEETGAVVRLTDNRDYLRDCHLIIAPTKIDSVLPLAGDAIVLSGKAPSVCLPGNVYYNDNLRMPNSFDEIKPEELSEEYFCGALYTKAHQYELGSIVPGSCSNSNSTQTCASIGDYLKKTSVHEEKNTETEEKLSFDLT